MTFYDHVMTSKKNNLVLKYECKLKKKRGNIMFNTNLVYSCQNHIWKLPIWDYLVNEVSNV